ncbi:MAG: type I-A CRISPR-associated protein Cas5a [Nitrososphaeria archaeon]
MPIGYIFDIEFVWGFQSRIVGLSKTSPSFYYPPPTTILGAIAEAIAKEHNISESNGKKIIPLLSNNLLAIGLKPINCLPIKYEDLNRIISVKITSGELYPDPKDLRKSFDSPASGKTIFSTFDNNSATLRCFIVFKKDKVLFDDKNIAIDENIFWHIHRVGSKESIVSISDVKKMPNLVINKGSVTTNYSFTKTKGVNLKNEIVKRWGAENYIDPFNIKTYVPIKDYIFRENLVEYLIPIKVSHLSEPTYYVELDNNFVCYQYDNEKVIGKWLE